MNKEQYKGLTNREVSKSRDKYGPNTLGKVQKESIFMKMIKVIEEPALSLLLLAASIYFFLGEIPDGIIMLCSVLFTCGIEFFEEYKTDKALEELNKISDLNVTVIRNGKEISIKSEDIVVGDIIILKEGDCVPADGRILESSGLGVNESALTGESATVYKTTDYSTDKFKKNYCYKGTSIVNGSAIIEITNVGTDTEYGKIGEKLKNIKTGKNNLQKQVNKIVKIYGLASLTVFILVVIVTYFNNTNLELTDRITFSLISGITVGMATIPEEIPVILTVFFALGAWRLSKKKTLAKNIHSVESLGEITVLCTDKTGTLTENKMLVKDTYIKDNDFFECMYLCNPKTTFDSMEEALKDYSENKISNEEYNIIHEFIFNNKDKMTGQIVKYNDETSLYVKGAYENVIKLCHLESIEKDEILAKAEKYSKEGLRVLALAKAKNIKVLDKIKDYDLVFNGLVAFIDPPRKGIKDSIEKCYHAGIRTIMITGDNGVTASGIAKQIGIKNYDEVLTGEDIENMSFDELKEKVKTVNIYSRVYPNTKVEIVEALQKNGEVVAMTGDGINDATALKKADIGISMGLRGTNVAKEASDIILLDDNFNTIVDAIENGRTIYNNIKKSIMFILAIHIPIALLSLIVPALGYTPFLFPIHIVISELLIDPTSAILFERIKPNKDIMDYPPRKKEENIIKISTLFKCISIGLSMFIVTFFTYIYVFNNYSYNLASSITYSVLILSIMLVANSLREKKLTIINIVDSLKERMNILVNLVIILLLVAIIYIPFLQTSAKTTNLSIINWVQVIGLSFLTIIPYDIYKLIRKEVKYEEK